MPALCRKLNVPFCIVKSRARLGTLVHQKVSACVAIVDVHKEDKNDLSNLQTVFTESFNKNAESRKQWGGGRLPTKVRSTVEAFVTFSAPCCKEKERKGDCQRTSNEVQGEVTFEGVWSAINNLSRQRY